MKRRLKPVPKFANEDEERHFWEQHDTSEYLDWNQAQVETDDKDDFSSTPPASAGFNQSCGQRSRRTLSIVDQGVATRETAWPLTCPSRKLISHTKHLGFHGQSYPLFVGEQKPLSFELILEHTVLFDETIDDRLLLAVKPAGQSNYEEMEGLQNIWHFANRLSVILIDNNIIQFVRIFAPYGVRLLDLTEVFAKVIFLRPHLAL